MEDRAIETCENTPIPSLFQYLVFSPASSFAPFPRATPTPQPAFLLRLHPLLHAPQLPVRAGLLGLLGLVQPVQFLLQVVHVPEPLHVHLVLGAKFVLQLGVLFHKGRPAGLGCVCVKDDEG